jgi:hypothetical protein
MMMELSGKREKPGSAGTIEGYVNKFMLKADTQADGVIDKREFYLFYKRK